jgi:L-asparaginase/Glu-tRNA(Gln) amidotransferase subunit D
MTKAQETKARRAAVLAILGAGWKASKGIEGARDMYKRGNVVVMPQRTVDGNFYVGGPRGFTYAQTIEHARDAAAQYA